MFSSQCQVQQVVIGLTDVVMIVFFNKMLIQPYADRFYIVEIEKQTITYSSANTDNYTSWYLKSYIQTKRNERILNRQHTNKK